MTNKPIRSFRDLEIYQNSYKASVIVAKRILPKLPENEKYDLRDQVSRSTKAIPRLIAEGYAKRHQKMGFQKYIDDAMGECNEMVVSLEQCKDISLNKEFIDKTIDMYDKSGRQLYRLGESWTAFKRRQT